MRMSSTLCSNFHFRGEEPQVIDYQTQQEKLFPLLASTYALYFTGDVMLMEYMRINADMEKGIFDEMAAVNISNIFYFFIDKDKKIKDGIWSRMFKEITNYNTVFGK
jgi:hypothetical protein